MLYNVRSASKSYLFYLGIIILNNKMNPENVGEHIPLKHSSLWRKPLIYEKTQKELPLCHLQLNLSRDLEN